MIGRVACTASWLLLVCACNGSEGGSPSGSSRATSSGPTPPATSAKPAASSAAAPATPGSAPPPGSSASAQAPSAPSSTVPGGTAFAHVSSDCQLIVIGDVAKMRALPAVSKQLVPKLDDLYKKAKPKNEAVKKAVATARELGLTPTTVQNVALCGKGFDVDKPTFGALAATELKPGSVISFFEKATGTSSSGGPLKDVGGSIKEVGGVKVVSSPNGLVGQLQDGVLQYASQDEMFALLVPTSDAVSRLSVDVTKELAFYASEPFIKRELRKPGSKTAEAFEDVTELHGLVDLGANKATVRATTTSSFAALKLAAGVALMKDDIAKENLGKNPYGAADIVRSIVASTDGADVLLEATIPASSLDSAASGLAKELEELEKRL